MNIDSLVRAASTTDAVATLTLSKGLDNVVNQTAQLLKALPPAPQPAHLGNSVDLKV
jgi:hypothetical protein